MGRGQVERRVAKGLLAPQTGMRGSLKGWAVKGGRLEVPDRVAQSPGEYLQAVTARHTWGKNACVLM